jgi:hypothetical protein
MHFFYDRNIKNIEQIQRIYLATCRTEFLLKKRDQEIPDICIGAKNEFIITEIKASETVTLNMV